MVRTRIQKCNVLECLKSESTTGGKQAIGKNGLSILVHGISSLLISQTMKFTTVLFGLLLCVLTSADYAPRRTITTTIEICGCTSVDAAEPTASIAPIEPFTTLACCPTCPPIPVTRTDQLITSCTTPVKSTTVICTDSGVHTYGGNLYTCSNTPCTFTYPAPCPTCYVCPFDQCWTLDSEFKTKHVKVYEYFDESLVNVCEQEWLLTVSSFNHYITNVDLMLHQIETVLLSNNLYRKRYHYQRNHRPYYYHLHFDINGNHY